MCLALIKAWVRNYIHYKVWDEITYPFLNFSSCVIEDWELISDFIQQFIMHVIIYGLKLIHVHKRGPGGRLNVKMLSYQYRDSHVKDKTVSPTVLSLT